VNAQGYALLGLTAIVGIVAAVVVFAVLRFAAAARDNRHVLREDAGQSPLLAIALQEAIQKLRVQERAHAERADASELLNTQIVNSLTAGLLVVDRAGHVKILNPAGRKMLGVHEGAAAKIGELPLSAAPLAAAITECLSTGHPIVRRALEMPHAGAVTHVGVTVSPLDSGDTTTDGGAICLFSDLTTIIDLEEQLRLKETLARLGELTAGIAHEFRNGLATIHGYGKLLDPGALPPQFKLYVEGIRQETESLGQVVTNFLNFARPTQLSLATHDLGAIIERVSEDLRPEARQLNGDIVVKGEFGKIEADDVLLRQAFMNLLRNAIEACQGHGVSPDVRVEGAVDTATSAVRVTVRDNGPGIPADAREKVFRPFFTTKKTGTGLGLALVQKIIVTHNGRITATAAQGGGASFQVTLPIT
jgi:nitrogen fixation/metabolism regulation signal transduction histidine kinase